MKVLIAIKGSEEESFFRRVAALAPLDRADDIILAHVIDLAPRVELELSRQRYLGRGPLREERRADLAIAEEEGTRAALQLARQALVTAGVPDDRLREVGLRGKPNEALRQLAEREGVDLVVVGGRPGKPGPHSVGKTARFLVDHCPRAALLVR